jgi:hypothetical protein
LPESSASDSVVGVVLPEVDGVTVVEAFSTALLDFVVVIDVVLDC